MWQPSPSSLGMSLLTSVLGWLRRRSERRSEPPTPIFLRPHSFGHLTAGTIGTQGLNYSTTKDPFDDEASFGPTDLTSREYQQANKRTTSTFPTSLPAHSQHIRSRLGNPVWLSNEALLDC
ncbi:uncharacterized protein L3040_004502 [Drepanopeziza brunnea f. sp. 'multigermtubi']|uniref:uncharacterized protein n=1 Tax=Drepanopeziza brunnea f. sp. 'multigermtubi' TaxID=698441 RepID=UPI0023A15D69|nr:hypothetical protein L3040_004502 [Drepanopeziza brunnea f. sp. 'multigermtubi']